MSSLSSIYNLENDNTVTINKLKNPQLSTTDHVRCFCNLPQCVTTGYMCKSPGGRCFSNFMDHFHHQSNDYRGQHGCLELLTDKLQRTSCEENPQRYVNKTQRKKNTTNTLIFCCYHDMCNHIDSPQTKNIINRTLPGSGGGGGEISDYTISDHQQPMDYTNSQLWFRAATIAVPICGAFILFVLIAIAIKILRNENRYSTNQKLGSSYYNHPISSQTNKHCKMYENILKNHHYQQQQQQHGNMDEIQRIQVPLLIQNELTPIHYSNCSNNNSNDKNVTNAKLNLSQTDPRVILEIEKDQSIISEINLINSKNCDDDLKAYFKDKV